MENVYGDYGLDFVSKNVLLAGWLVACFLFAFFLLSGHTAFGVEIDQTLRFQKDKIKVKKSAPKKLDHFIYFPHLLITSLTLFIYYPFTNCCATLIARIVEACCWQVCQDMGFAKITSLNLRDSEDQDVQKIGGINCRMADILCCKQVLIAGYWQECQPGFHVRSMNFSSRTASQIFSTQWKERRFV